QTDLNKINSPKGQKENEVFTMAKLVKANIPMTAKALTKKLGDGTVSLDNAVQRGFVWDVKRQSLLIHSMLTGYPIPPIFASKCENVYDLLDGKQRITTVANFIKGEFALKDIPEVEDENGELIDINGMTFSDLPENLQDDIKDYSFTIYYFDGISDDEIAEMFTRLNNGKPLSAIELTRVKAKSIKTIQEITKHEIFSTALSEKALKSYKDEDIVIKAWLLLNSETNPSFVTKDVRAKMAEADITAEQRQEIETALTRILLTYKHIKENTFDPKMGNKISKRIVTPTHMISLIPIALQSVEDNISVGQFSKWASAFFNGSKRASTCDLYNDNAGQGTAKPENIRRRNEALFNSYNETFADIATGEGEQAG
ncbi:MAG: DUF262 domain-containing protein, partial [Ruminococcus sp.]|nr:DUF262 domain-containing protein [Ruminococcus sp.]